MEHDTFIYTFKTTGLERKRLAAVIAGALGVEVKYTGVPSFSYQVAGWIINREGLLTSPEISISNKENLWTVMNAIKATDASVEGNGIVTLSMKGHSGISLRNLVNLIGCKHNLIKKPLNRQQDIFPADFVLLVNSVPIETVDDFGKVINDAIDAGGLQEENDLDFDLVDKAIQFSFSNASLETDEVNAFITLCRKISEQAKQQKFTSTKQKATTNDCYAFRCFLLKLGFIGNTYKTDRKILLRKLNGNESYAAFKTPEAQLVAEEKRKARSSQAQ